jgi:hypothetical protein
MTTPITFCCEQMRHAVNDVDIPIEYAAHLREYGVRVLDGGTSRINFNFCPWCGQRLPASLRDAWFHELDALGLDAATDEIPSEFLDERWYANRRS